MNSRDIEDLYELTPLQQGMLFHTIYSPSSSLYFEQFGATITGGLNVEAFRGAWQGVVDRHAVLRTSFYWEDLSKPLQLVHPRAELPIEEQDWRGRTREEQRRLLEDFLRADRERGFRLDEAPLMRLALLRLSGGDYHAVLSFHHILLDGWSKHLLNQEVAALYRALCGGPPARLSAPRPFANYLGWLQRQDLQAAERYWRRVLAGFQQPTRPAIMRAASGGWEQDIRRAETRLTRSETAAVQELARICQVTINTVVQAAWAVLLGRYSGTRDVVYGTVVSGRPPSLPGVESTLGLFINTLPARVVLDDTGTTVAELLRKVQEQQSEMREYEYSPLFQVQAWSELPRGTALFDSILVFENYPSGPVAELAQETGDDFAHEFERTNYPLTILAIPGAQLGLRALYSSAHFDAFDGALKRAPGRDHGSETTSESSPVARMLVHMRQLLLGFCADVNRPVRELPLLDESERQEVLEEWNATEREYSRELCLHELVARQAAERGEATALVCGQERLSYREMEARSNQFGHYLQRQGVGPERMVGIALERSVEMVVALLGILKAGGAYVPLDPNYPRERLKGMLDDAGVEVVVTSLDLRERLPLEGRRCLCLDLEREAIASESRQPPASGVTAANLAYVIFTSGSTGRPKGVAMTRRALTNLIEWQLRRSRGSGTTLQFASLSFDVSFQEIFATLCGGGMLVIASSATRLDPAALFDLLACEGVERLFLPFIALEQLASEANRSRSELRLREVITAGEQLRVTPAIAEFFSRPRGCALYNQYGPTETHVVTEFALPGDVSRWHHLPPIGRPIDHARIYLLDEALEPAPPGVPGRLYAGGACLARGYLNRPELTADRFICDPYSTVPGARMYDTGDLAMWRTDGNIEFLGRADDQVKIRGFRVELGEIEAALDEHKGVRQAAVISRGDVPGGRLVAFVVPADPPPEIEDLREYLASRLPEYMQPSTIVLERTLPLTPTGKVNRRALQAPAPARPGNHAFAAPQGDTEETVAAIWAEVLRLDRVGADDNFFELGGHSLVATQLVSRIRQAFDTEFPLRLIFEKPSVRQIAAEVEQRVLRDVLVLPETEARRLVSEEN